jgi:outer membrane protein OmpA-like peptidoglycan-associated protein/tetratricopeptide (TPR) repeat protein
MNKSVILFIILNVIALGCFSQSASLRNANKLFSSKLYQEAILKYESILKKDPSNVEALSNLGDCYRLTNDNKGQLKCYGKLVDAGKAEEKQKLYYGQALLESGSLDEAKKVFDTYQADNRGEMFIKAINDFEKFSKNADAYKVERLSFNSKYDDFGAVSFFDDKVLFASNITKPTWVTTRHGWTGKSYNHIYMTQKDAKGKYSKPVVFLTDIASKYNDGPLCVSRDSQYVFITRNSFKKKEKSEDGSQKLHIYQAKIEKGFVKEALELKFNNKEFNCAHPAISGDGKTLYFSSDMGGGKGGMDIWYCKLDESGAWGTPINMGETVNTEGNEVFPYVTNDNVLYFASNGHSGIGGLDVFESVIKDEKAGKSYNMGKPINTEHDDFAYNLITDTTAFISSNRKSGGMNDDIYSVQILRKVKRGKTVNFVLKDRDSKEPIDSVYININGDSLLVNEKGELTYEIEDGVSYKIEVKNPKYSNFSDSISTTSFEGDEFTKSIDVEKHEKFTLFARVFDSKTGTGIDEVRVKLKDLSDNEFELFKTDKNGEYRKHLKNKQIGDTLAYLVTIEKEGFLTKTLDFKVEIKKEGEIEMNEMLEMSIGKPEVGNDIAKMIGLKPVYYGSGKAVISPESAKELDKIVKVMKENPLIVVELGAHTDCRGSAATNLKLSTIRGKAAAFYIIDKGIDVKRITGKGYGESHLINNCGCEKVKSPKCTDAELAKNRRTEFIIVDVNK